MTSPEASTSPPSAEPSAVSAEPGSPVSAPSTQQTQPSPSPAAPLVTSQRPAWARPFGWFWRGREVKRALQLWRAQRAVVGSLEDRAQLLFVCAERLRRPSESLPASADPIAADLYRQSLTTARRALAVVRRGDAEPTANEPLADDDWALAPDQQAKRADELRAAARRALDELELPLRARDNLLLLRALRVGGLVVVIAAVLGAVSFYLGRLEHRRDLADGKPWRTSSSYNNMGCTSPIQQCSESPDFFFHTREESNAWIEIDLGQRTSFSAVRVVNRKDCCFERAVPLVVEVSDRQEGFREVARRTSSFKSWLGSFAPTQARYVRVRAPSRTALHLAQVRVLR